MSYYGGTQKTTITKDVLGCVLNFLAEEYWYKLKWNQKILTLMSSLHKKGKVEDLARYGLIESLRGRHVRFDYICEFGSVNLVWRVIFSLTCEPDWIAGLHGACRGTSKDGSGHIKMVNLMMSNVDHRWITSHDYNRSLYAACLGGHKEIVDLIIGKGATNWNVGLRAACRGNHMEIIDLMISRGRPIGIWVWKEHVEVPQGGSGHLNIIDLMIAKGANNWGDGFWEACRGGNISSINSMISKGVDNWNYGLCGACRGGHMDIVKLMIFKGANRWNDGLINACEGGHLDIVNLMIDKGANKWDKGLIAACQGPPRGVW